MIIREAKKEDAHAIIDFQLAMAKETEEMELDPDILNKGIESLFNDTTKGQYYVMENNDKIVGSVLTTYEWSDWRNGTIIWLQSVYILPEFRGKKLFSKMYDHLKQKVLNNSNLIGLRLYVDNRNLKAQKVYEKVGMNGDHYKTYEWIKD